MKFNVTINKLANGHLDRLKSLLQRQMFCRDVLRILFVSCFAAIFLMIGQNDLKYACLYSLELGFVGFVTRKAEISCNKMRREHRLIRRQMRSARMQREIFKKVECVERIISKESALVKKSSEN